MIQIRLYTNPQALQPDATVLDPFMGIGSTAYVAIEQGRSAIGFELKESYHSNALKNVERAKTKATSREETTAGLFGEVA